MTFSIRRLAPGDEGLLALLARDDADFDLAGRGRPTEPLEPEAARRYFQDPAVLHWVATEGDEVVGHLQCTLVSLRNGDGRELLLYEIGVRGAWRRRGVGTALLDRMEVWMRENGVADVWVLADNPEAVDFYGARGFAAEEPQPVYMVRRVGPRSE